MKCFWSILWILLPLCGHSLEVNGTDYLSLRQVAGKLGMKTRWVEKGEIQRLESKWTHLDFEVHKREMLLNQHRIHLGFPIVESRGRLYLSESDYTHTLRPILTPQLLGTPPRLRHIVLDAGHGGKDPGAENEALGLHEKALALDLTKRVQRLLEAKGFRVSLIRETDDFVPLEDRPAQANRIQGDLFVSLHFNASAKATVSGVETYAFTPPSQPSTARANVVAADRQDYPAFKNDGWSTLAAYYVQRSLFQSLKVPDRGLKRARFTVLRDLTMPGILVEGGFVTHSDEGLNIGSANYRERMAQAIVEGILVYQRTVSRLSAEEH